MAERNFQRVPTRDEDFSAAARAAAAGSMARTLMAHPSGEWRAASPIANDSGARATCRLVASHDLISPLQLIADVAAIMTVALITTVIYDEVVYGGPNSPDDCAWTAVVVALLFTVLERFSSARPGLFLTSGFDRLRSAARTWSLAFGGLLFMLFALKAGTVVSRGFLLSFYLAGLVLVGGWRALAPPKIAKLSRRLGYHSGDCILIGDGRQPGFDAFVGEFSTDGDPAPLVIRFDALCDGSAWPEERKKMRGLASQAAAAVRHGGLYLYGAGLSADRLASISRSLSLLPIALYVVPDSVTAGFVKCRASTIGTRVAVEVRRAPLNRLQRAIKRGIDVTLAAALITFLLPLFVAVSVAIKLDSEGPILFRQTRTGLGGKLFRIWKFRTMHVMEDGPVIRQACRDDPRITSVGRYLRKTSIDELPQLLNVLKGDMSLVGPRPHAQAHDELYRRSIDNYEVRQHFKPGITGWAQIHGLRGETVARELMDRRIEFDLWYAMNASLLLDCEILIRTIFEVCRRRNAY